MAPPKKPLNVYKLTGSAKHNPSRVRERENAPTDKRPVGPCPSYLTGEEKKAWREIVKSAIPGVLCRADRIAIEACSKLVAKMRSQAVAEDSRRTKMRQAIDNCDFTDPLSVQGCFYDLMDFSARFTQWNGSDQTSLRVLLGQFAMLPCDRQKLTVVPDKTAANKFAEDE